jgi:hypothetical protein
LLAIPMSMVLARHTFSDVPTSAFYHDAVEAIANANVTAGCGGTKYCPNNAVTRGQMAVFLNKLGALGENTTPVADALSTNGVQTNFFPTALNSPAEETSIQHCEARSTLSETDTFVAMAQLVDPPQNEIPDFEVWIDYDAAGLDPDQFNVCVKHDAEPDLQEGTYVIQLTTLEYIGQQVHASGARANNASTARSARSGR